MKDKFSAYVFYVTGNLVSLSTVAGSRFLNHPVEEMRMRRHGPNVTIATLMGFGHLLQMRNVAGVSNKSEEKVCSTPGPTGFKGFKFNDLGDGLAYHQERTIGIGIPSFDWDV